jgi:ATP-dependent Clp protease adaptor protein ClpS
MGFVTMVFEKVLSLSRAEAERKMWEVHNKGRSIVWQGSREPAEVILQQLHLYGLQARLERAGEG